MKYFKEEKEILEKLRDDLKEYFELEKNLSSLGKKRPEEKEKYQQWKKKLYDLSNRMDNPIFDIPKQIKKLDPPIYWIERITGREVGYWARWKRKAKKKVKNLAKEQQKEAKEELESLMPLHWELKEYEGQLDGSLDSVVAFWDKEVAMGQKRIDELDKEEARLNAEEARLNAEEARLNTEEARLKKDVVEIEKEEACLKEELRRRGRFDLLKKLEEKELKSRQKKQT